MTDRSATTVITDVQVQAMSMIGKVVSYAILGQQVQGRVSDIEAKTWTTGRSGNKIYLDTECTPLSYLDDLDPTVHILVDGGVETRKIGQVKLGVNLRK